MYIFVRVCLARKSKGINVHYGEKLSPHSYPSVIQLATPEASDASYVCFWGY